jgi:hypothetical protein
MFEPTSYKTSMDDQGYYSYYTRGDYTLYQSYFYSGLSTSQSYDGSSGQTCSYKSVYKYWSLYGTTTYNCSRASKTFVMQHSTFKKIGFLFGFVVAGVFLLSALGFSFIRLHRTKKRERVDSI